jgi:predicted amidohydrolase YtcJ
MDELLITGVRVWTGGAERAADTVATRGGGIVAVGREAEVRDAVGARAGRLHRPGCTVLPGFQDAHVHPAFAGRYRRELSLHDLSTVDAYRAAVREHAARSSDEWIYGAGWSTEVFPRGYPTADLLDDIVPDRPVFLLNSAIHEAWVNTEALRRAGITAATPDPEDGRYQRDPTTGAPTGALYEGAAYAFEARHLPGPTVPDWAAALKDAQQHLHSLGITGWQDAWVTPGVLAAYRALEASGDLTARVSTALWWERSRGVEQIADFLDVRGETERLRTNTVKIMADGVLENGSGAVLTPYCHDHARIFDPARDTGYCYLPPAVLTEAVATLDRHGFQTHLHTIGDRAVRHGLDALEHARAANGRSDHRHTLAHVQLVDPADLPRFAKLGAVANCQTYWAQPDDTMILTGAGLGEERAARQYPFASLAATGARLAMGSDWPVSTADPLWQLEVAIRRQDPTRRDDAPFAPHERLTLAQALTAATAGSAYVDHDDDAGHLEPGRRADLVILSGDLLDGAPPADCRVEHTIAAGRIVYSAAD